jgi:hypothetical protein
MSEVMLAELLRATPHGRRQSTLSTDEARDAKLSPSEARDEVGAWLGQLQRDAEQAGASPAQRSALSYLRRSFLGVLTALAAPRIEEVGESSQRIGLGNLGQPFPKFEARVDLSQDLLFEQLRAAAEALDDLLAGLAPPPSPEPKPWADDDRLLDLLQPLFGALVAESGEAAIFELGRLAERLRADAIEMVLANDTTADWFTLYDGDADGYVTVTPAIAARGELRRRGEARRPRDGGPGRGVVAEAGDPQGRRER